MATNITFAPTASTTPSSLTPKVRICPYNPMWNLRVPRYCIIKVPVDLSKGYRPEEKIFRLWRTSQDFPEEYQNARKILAILKDVSKIMEVFIQTSMNNITFICLKVEWASDSATGISALKAVVQEVGLEAEIVRK